MSGFLNVIFRFFLLSQTLILRFLTVTSLTRLESSLPSCLIFCLLCRCAVHTVHGERTWHGRNIRPLLCHLTMPSKHIMSSYNAPATIPPSYNAFAALALHSATHYAPIQAHTEAKLIKKTFKEC